jgi:hypothetical protein
VAPQKIANLGGLVGGNDSSGSIFCFFILRRIVTEADTVVKLGGVQAAKFDFFGWRESNEVNPSDLVSGVRVRQSEV